MGVSKQENSDVSSAASTSSQDTVTAAKSPSSESTAKIKAPQAPTGHSTYFKLCELILEKRGDPPEANVMLRMALEKLSELSISLESEMESELKSAEKEYLEYREKYLEKKRVLEDSHASLDQAVITVIEKNSVIINDPVEHSEIMNECLEELATAKAQSSKAKADFGSITSSYKVAEARYNAAKARRDAEQKIAKVKDEIDLNIAFAGYTISSN
ncbi:hypothetical protein EV183_002652 [Coemansia sp. RSA 2336]|nr:hypothetical protein EV183_002652 [Coemansia sp. RSA 2336]